MQNLANLPDDVPSPCVGVCELDAAKVCTGCGRSIVEIAEWSRAGATRRLQIRQQAEQRLSLIPVTADVPAND